MRLKTAKVTPLHKGGKLDDVSNYRPISVLPALSKIYERVMYDRLDAFLMRSNILTQYQFGFRKRVYLSPETTIVKLQELASGKFVIAVFLHVKKGF